MILFGKIGRYYKMQNNCLFIFCHNWEIIEFYEKNIFINNNTFIKYKYVLLGENYKLDDNIYGDKVIISCLLPNNIENNKNYLQWCGWYSLVKNNLIQEYDYIYLFEYDVKLLSKFYEIFSNINNEYDIYGTQKLDKKICYLNYDYFNYGLCKYLETNNINIQTLLNTNLDYWMVTSNLILKPYILENIINSKEFNDLLLNFSNDKIIGHYLERFTTVFCDINNIKYGIIDNVNEHYAFDSHKTQGKTNYNLNQIL